MRRVGLLLIVTALAGCSWFYTPPPPVEQKITPGARVIYHGGIPVFTICDRGNLLYMTTNGPISVIPNGCPTGNP
jgi:hypothetical protein